MFKLIIIRRTNRAGTEENSLGILTRVKRWTSRAVNSDRSSERPYVRTTPRFRIGKRYISCICVCVCESSIYSKLWNKTTSRSANALMYSGYFLYTILRKLDFPNVFHRNIASVISDYFFVVTKTCRQIFTNSFYLHTTQLLANKLESYVNIFSVNTVKYLTCYYSNMSTKKRSLETIVKLVDQPFNCVKKLTQ